MSTYDDTKKKVQDAMASGQIDRVPSREQRIDFAYGNTKIENEAVTREMCERAVDTLGVDDEGEPEITHIRCEVCSKDIPLEEAWSYLDHGVAHCCSAETCRAEADRRHKRDRLAAMEDKAQEDE